MKHSINAPNIARIVFGLILLVFGLNGFLRFLPMPPPPERAMSFFMELVGTGYMLPLIKGVEVVTGVLLLSNRFVPLALALVAPNVVNIVLFHLFLAPSGIPLAIVVLALEAYLAWVYRETYRPMLVSRVSLGSRPSSTDAKIGGALGST
jgi:uncharacterized membrane protein YphA (DoxX/SURF4 family)